jgi:hemolysin-activating ACP:hemolysin acyltransferase
MKGSPTLQLPVGVALWANVSPEVAERLEEARRNARICRLMPKDWQSGDILWLIDVVGPRELHEPMLAQLMQTAFKGREFRGFGTRR